MSSWSKRSTSWSSPYLWRKQHHIVRTAHWLTPRSKTTTHFLSTDEFNLLHKSNPRGTFVANIARGQVIDQPALVKALEDGLISGAALDVTDPEPLPADDPLWTAPNVLITPHVSGSTDVYADRAFEVLRENMRRMRSGGKLVNEVDRGRGY
jgi:phosphoglycerate dehydrogenase-like enzyme